jgi:hypothetical protein
VKRRLLNVAAAISLALGATSLTMAVRSCWIDDDVIVAVSSLRIMLDSYAGVATIGVLKSNRWAASEQSRYSKNPVPRGAVFETKMTRFYFRCADPLPYGDENVMTIVFPCWVPVAPFFCIAWWFRRKARKLAPRVGFVVEPVAAQKPENLHNNLTTG